MRTKLIPLTLAALVLIPTVALAGDRHRGGGDYHGAVRPGDNRGGWNNGNYGNYGNHRRRYSGPSVQVVVPTFRPRFYVAPSYSYRPRHHVVVFGTPHWRTGRWYHGWYGGQVGWFWGVNNVYYHYETRVAEVPPAPVAAPVDAPPVNYYCASQGDYYPNLQTCPEEWTVVQAQPVSPI